MANLETILNIRVEGTSDMIKFKDEINKTEQELKDLKAQQKAAGDEGGKFTKQIVEQETKLKGLRKGYNSSKTELLKMNDAVKSTGKSYNDLTKQNAALVVQLKKLQDPLGKDQKEFQKLSAQINNNTNSLKKMDSAMGRSQRNVGNYGQSIRNMGLQIGAAVMAFKTLERVIGTFVDFEFQIKQVGVISGATAEEMAMLEKNAKDLGSSTAFTAGEVAGLQKELAKLGFNPAEIENMTSSVLDLAFAFGEDLGQTSTIVGATLRQFNLDAEEASRVTDVMAASFANSALDLQKFEVSMAKVAPVANAMGFSLEDTTAILGTLTNAGIDASTAGTSLRNIFLKLADPTGDLAKALGRNVNSVDELIPAMQELEKKGIDVAGMLEITDKRSVTAFASMLAGSTSIDELAKKMQNAEGTTQRFADVMRDTLKGQIDAVKSAAEGFAIELIDNLSPALEVAMNILNAMFQVLKFLAPVIVTATAAFVSYKAIVIATNAATKLYNIATTAMRIVTIATTGGVKGLNRALKLLNISIKANPIGLLVAGLTTGVALLSSFSSKAEDSAEDMDSLASSTEKFSEIEKEAVKNQASQLANAKQLISTIQDENAKRSDRLKAIEDLNKITPLTIKNIDDEKEVAEKLAGAYEDVVKAIKLKIVNDVANKKLIALAEKELAIEEELVNVKNDYNKSLQQNLNLTQEEIDAGGKIIETFDAQGKAIKKFVSIEEIEKKKQKELRDKLIEATRFSKTGIVEFDNAMGKHLELTRKVNNLEGKLNDVKTEGVKIQKEANAKAKEFNIESEKEEKVVTKKLTAYQQLQENVKIATEELKKAITTNGDTTAAAEKLKKAKQELMEVDAKVAKVNKEVADSFKEPTNAYQDQVDAIQETINAEQKQLDQIEKLKKAGADLAKEQIEQALKVAKARLDLALVTIQASNDDTSKQVENINKLKSEIKSLETELGNFGKSADTDGDSGSSGFLGKALFGTKDGEEPFTGEEFLQAVGATMSQVMDIMSEVNAMQQAETDAQIQGIEGEKQTELDALRETTAFKIASSEEQAKMEEEITKKHDKKILDLKVKQFERDKKMMKAQAIMSGAMAIMSIWSGTISGNPVADAIIKGILTAAQVALTGVQIATIEAQAPPTAELGGIMNDDFFANGGMVHGRSHAEGGEKFAVGGRVVELEGGEAVINKRSTAMFKPLLSQLNQAGGGRKFADGGLTMATDALETQSLSLANSMNETKDQKVFLVEADVTESQIAVKNIEAQATF
tara:strand:+ start:14411 stop:18193 length:3783 start_codon:yes stop_codon:yes gene_type:complete